MGGGMLESEASHGDSSWKERAPEGGGWAQGTLGIPSGGSWDPEDPDDSRGPVLKGVLSVSLRTAEWSFRHCLWGRPVWRRDQEVVAIPRSKSPQD